jgi:hypothetical protein
VGGLFCFNFLNDKVNSEQSAPIGYNVLQISEGTNSVGFSEGIWAFAYLLLAAVFFLFDFQHFRKQIENIFEIVCSFKTMVYICTQISN